MLARAHTRDDIFGVTPLNAVRPATGATPQFVYILVQRRHVVLIRDE